MAQPPLPMTPFLRNGFDLAPELDNLRAEQPIYRLPLPEGAPTTWLVTRYADVRTVLADSRTFSNDLTRLAAAPQWQAAAANDGGLAFRDPPQHTRLRRLLAPEFTPRRLARLQPRITALVTEHLDAMEHSGPSLDLVPAFTAPIPSLVIAELLGVPDDERTAFARHSHDRFDFTAGPDASLAAATTSVDHLEHLVTTQRGEPGPGLLGALIREHGDTLSDREIAGLADGLLTGGHDTTASMLALGAAWLLTHPHHAALARHNHEPTVAALAEELLRYLCVVQVGFPRLATTDTTLAETPIATGDMLLCSLSAANRDPTLSPDPDRVDPARESTPHLAFGHGIHHCLGAPLARMQLRTAYPALLRRFPTLRLAIPPEQIAFRPLSIIYGTPSLPVTWT